MKKLILLPIIMICLGLTVVNAQPPVKVRNGLIYMDDDTLSPNQKKYQLLTDSLDRNLKLNANDTTSLFYRSVLLLRYNSMIAKPAQTEQSAFDYYSLSKWWIGQTAFMRNPSSLRYYRQKYTRRFVTVFKVTNHGNIM